MKAYWLALTAGVGLVLTVAADESDLLWPMAGHDSFNTRSQPEETQINPGNAGGLRTKWIFHTGGDVSATPSLAGDALYFPDWGGNLYAVNKTNGELLWAHRISDYDGVPGAISRVTPAVHNDQLILGDQQSAMARVHSGPASWR